MPLIQAVLFPCGLRKSEEGVRTRDRSELWLAIARERHEMLLDDTFEQLALMHREKQVGPFALSGWSDREVIERA